MGLKDQGAGMPDGGLFTESQFRKRGDAEPLPGQAPERGVIEVKPVGTDVNKLIGGDQVARYWSKYRLILVTDIREFVLLGEEAGVTVERERYKLATTPQEFWELARHPRKAVADQGVRLVPRSTVFEGARIRRSTGHSPVSRQPIAEHFEPRMHA